MQTSVTQALASEVNRRGALRPLILPALLGILVGAAIYATIPIWFYFLVRNLPGLFTFHPLNLVMLGVLAACAVVLGSRWPVLGISAGVTILVPVTYAALRGYGPVRPESTWDVQAILAFGGLSGYPVIFGAVFALTAILSLRARSSVSRPQP